MGESVLHDNPFVGVEGQHLLKEVKGLQHLVHNMLTKQRCSQPPTVSIPFPPWGRRWGKACSRGSLACKAGTAGNFEPLQRVVFRSHPSTFQYDAKPGHTFSLIMQFKSSGPGLPKMPRMWFNWWRDIQSKEGWIPKTNNFSVKPNLLNYQMKIMILTRWHQPGPGSAFRERSAYGQTMITVGISFVWSVSQETMPCGLASRS